MTHAREAGRMSGTVVITILLAATAMTRAIEASPSDTIRDDPRKSAPRAQTPSGARTELTGTVRDTSGAVMQAVTVRVFEEHGNTPLRETATDSAGRFSVRLPPGRYRVEIAAPSFAPFTQVVTVPLRKPLDVTLDLDLIQMKVDVKPDHRLTANTAMSLTSTTLAGDDLLDLPRDEEELAEYLLQLAGADSTGDIEADVLRHFVIDGFDGGRLPRPEQIAQIIVDPNPMSADGRGPRIEIVTRPGSGRWRRSVDFGFADESLNARTPGERRKEPRQSRDVEFEVEGPIIRDRLEVSFEASMQNDDRAADSLRAITPAGTLFSGVVQPERGREFELGAELQISPSHRLDVRFTSEREQSANEGVGGFTLPERGSDDRSSEWSLQISERMLRQTLSNNFRVDVSRGTSRQVPVLEGVAIDVADAFSGGGGTSRGSDDEWAVRIDDNLRWARGPWNVEWSGRLQYEKRRSIDRDNYNGTFEFASLHDYCRATGFAGVNCGETQRVVSEAVALGVTPTYLDARGREVAITGVPTTFTQAFGNAELDFSELSFETHVQADRRVGEKASLRLGVRYEGTNHSRSYLRFNPTVNLQYRLTPSTLVSAGAQLAYDDFRDYERLLRNDGSTHETELFISSPSFPDPFRGGAVDVDENTASLWVLDPHYRSPYEVSPQVSVTQQLPGDVRLTLTYRASYGVHQRRTPNINAPHPGTPLPDEILDLPRSERQEIIDRMRPLYPHIGNITQIQTVGRSVDRTVRVRAQPRGELELFGIELSGNLNYTYRRADDDNDYNNPYIRQWGSSRRDHEVGSQFRIGLPDRVSFTSPVLRALARATYEAANLNFRFRANTGRLYSLRSGRDLNGDQSTRDRPLGVARNSETGPGSWNIDMTFTKDFEPGVGTGDGGSEGRGGGEGRGRGRRSEGPRIRFQARIDNLLNRTQPRGYGSVVTSPLFGLPTGYAAGRTVDLSLSVDF